MTQFLFTIANSGGWKTSFRGDGETITDAFKDGVKNVSTVFRPRDGKSGEEHGLMVEMRNGAMRKMTWKDFESGSPETEKAPGENAEFE